MVVSLQDFLRTGILGPIQLGMSRVHVREALGAPDHLGGTSRKNRVPTILKYGDLELLYRPGEDRLQAIHMDGFSIPRGSASMELDPWILIGGLAIGEAENALTAAKITYTKRQSPHDPSMIALATAAGVELGFIQEPEDGSIGGLYYVAKRG